MRYRILLPLVVLCAGALSTVAAGMFYIAQANHARTIGENEGFTPAQINAFKHAHAAAILHHHISRCCASQQHAAQLIVWLGFANEYMERVIKFAQIDSFDEMRKDLHNNHVGIKLSCSHSQRNTFNAQLIAHIKKGILISEHAQLPAATAYPTTTAGAIAWFRHTYPAPPPSCLPSK